MRVHLLQHVTQKQTHSLGPHVGIANVNTINTNKSFPSDYSSSKSVTGPSYFPPFWWIYEQEVPSFSTRCCAKPGTRPVCHSAQHSGVFIQVFYPPIVNRLCPLCAHKHTHIHNEPDPNPYESSFISWLSVRAIFLGGAGLSPSPCSCSLFFAAFCEVERSKTSY